MGPGLPDPDQQSVRQGQETAQREGHLGTGLLTAHISLVSVARSNGLFFFLLYTDQVRHQNEDGIPQQPALCRVLSVR